MLSGEAQDRVKGTISDYLNSFEPINWEVSLEKIDKPLEEPKVEPEALFPADDESIGRHKLD